MPCKLQHIRKTRIAAVNGPIKCLGISHRLIWISITPKPREQRLIRVSRRSAKTTDDLKLSGVCTASNDARSYAIIGDPAVRINVKH